MLSEKAVKSLHRGIGPFLAPAALVALSACYKDSPQTTTNAERHCVQASAGPVRIKAGSFLMGDDRVYAEEGPVREIAVREFWIDPHEVTNRQFADFTTSTGYVTQAEKSPDPALFPVPVERIPRDMLKPGSAVFTPPARPSLNYNDWWTYVPGASWKKPYGPDGPVAVPDHPVVHLGADDMQQYAQWRGGRLPTEAEWEYAASANPNPKLEQPEEANSWQGIFPVLNEKTDGFEGTAPVGCFAPNARGLYDMIGNVWEVTADYYEPRHPPVRTVNPRSLGEPSMSKPVGASTPALVMKGGSYLCAPNYCQRYRPAARQARDPAMGASNVGFRISYDRRPID